MTESKINTEHMTPAEKEYYEAVEAQKKAKKAIKEEKERHLQSLKEIFHKNYPKNEDGKPLTLKQFKENYTIIRKDQLNDDTAINREEYDRLMNDYKEVIGRLRQTADNIDRSQGFPKISDLSGFTKWVETFKSEN